MAGSQEAKPIPKRRTRKELEADELKKLRKPEKFTDAKVRALKARPDQRYRKRDTGGSNLFIVVSSRGKDWWWRGSVSNTDVMHKLGTFAPHLTEAEGHMSLNRAREASIRCSELAKTGRNPNDIKAAKAEQLEQERRDKASRKTFEELAVEHDAVLASKGRSEKTRLEYRRYFHNHMMSDDPKRTNWTGIAVADITKRDVEKALDKFRRRGSVHSAEHCRRALSSLFNYAVRRNYLSASPVPRQEVQTKVRDRVLLEHFMVDEDTDKIDASELLRVWHAAGELGVFHSTFVRLLIVLGCRRGELAQARWSEISLDDRQWVIPAERMKAGRAHRIWLSDLALELLDQLPRLSTSDLVFPARARNGDAEELQPMSGFNSMKRKLDAAIEKDGPMPAWRLHDLRRTFATGVVNLGTLEVVADMMLAHTPATRTGSSRSYLHSRYPAEMVAGWRQWSDFLKTQLGQRRPSNVVPLHSPS